MSSDQRQRVRTYFSRNYIPGRRVKVPEIPVLGSLDKRSETQKGSAEDWIEWMERRLKDIGFYDEFGNRIAESGDAPPRIFLRGDATEEEQGGLVFDDSRFDGKTLKDSHYEFKVWLQHKVEESRNGTGSLRILASERMGNEYEEYTNAFYRLSGKTEELFEREMDWSHIDGRHLTIMRKLIGRVDPDTGGKLYDSDWHSQRKTFEVSLGTDHSTYFKQLNEIKRMDSRRCLVRKICEATVRSVISSSKTTTVENEKIFMQRCEDDPLGFVGWAKENSVEISDKEVDQEIKAKFTRDGQFSEKYEKRTRKRELNKLGLTLSEYREKTKLGLIVRNLVRNGVEPKDHWKRVRISCPAIVLVRDLSNRIQNIITNSRERLGEILHSCGALEDYDRASDISPRDGISVDDILEGMGGDLEEAVKLFTTGFGAKKGGGQTSKGPLESDTHNSRKLAYNILIMLYNEGLLTNEPMTYDEYVAYFLDGDESRWKPRGGKRLPNLFLFTPRLLGWIGEKVDFSDFEGNRENAIFRHLRHDRSRYMYCEPEKHGFDREGELVEGGYLIDVQDGRVTSRYQYKNEYEDFDSLVVVDGEERVESNARCHVNEATANALNTLQSVQWEINLDLISRFFDLEMTKDSPAPEIPDSTDGVVFGSYSIPSCDAMIDKIVPKECFRGYFSDRKEDRENVSLSLLWATRIINHNANVFWHPWYCDFRGRMYPRCANLSPVGDDLNKALIRFKHWKKVGDSGFYWVQVHVHNLLQGIEGPWAGDVAKRGASFDERVAWVGKWEREIREMSRRPEEFSSELELDTHSHGKKDGLQRLAAIIEYDRLLTRYESEEVNGDWNEVYSGLPVHLDASCNGYQHISTLFRNVELAKTVNVITSDGGSRDVYELVAEAAKQRYSTEVRKFLNDNLEGSLANIAFERIFDRRLAKKPTMTRAYGSTRFTKAMSGRSGQGASIRSKPQLREWTKVQRKRIEWLEEKHPKFIKAREEYLENTKLGKRHYEKHAVKYKSKAELLEILRNNGYKGKREGAEPGKILKSNATRYELIEVVEGDSSISEEAVAFKWNKDSSEAESVAKSWMNLLKEEEEYQLWADGSGLHWAILEHPELRKEFCYDRDDAEGCGHLWKKQPELTKKTVKAFKGAIEEVCGVVYGDFEESFSRAVERSMGRYPGVRWETSETVDGTDSGFVVSNYYMKTQEGGSKAKWPTKRDSCYSGMTSLPHWYSESKDRGGWESEVKTTDRIKEKLRRFLDGLDRQVPRKMRNWEKRGKSGIEDVLGWVSSGKDDLSYLVDAIRPLLGHVSISVPFFSDNEDSRIDLDSMSSSICPNFIHSLDACHMRTAINRLGREFGDLGFWAVHDSFGTHPSRVGKLRDVVIASFWDIHRGRDIDWWLGKLKGPDGKLGMDEDGKLVSKESSKVFNIAEETSRSKYLIS